MSTHPNLASIDLGMAANHLIDDGAVRLAVAETALNRALSLAPKHARAYVLRHAHGGSAGRLMSAPVICDSFAGDCRLADVRIYPGNRPIGAQKRCLAQFG